ncbi:sugar-binding transcriptional regulator [Bifidobacterium psychraerophilum]|jgi:DNA-binding transcriptional regulator LsrR (DeoR family)|uniref:sugar-binding transcriptional regulator n=1 Tax=Bifidobacterium psychraerophilum TaxID=218140 RepID=UPI0023F18E88|nr:sugar-binding domain-containing protein [Bifidobacterium psychraerophilum]MCI1661252.1 helix-turn-helix domain-containing protein [Bifidobacterium psychraerophilum]MCI1803783.1 helix-turn-helix domain-containing protein [Bifidobacterium psychraerophilum]MCI2176209.1 helix-turn-helix domain-containing protein [Bifidobacterium psychraerophilum]MCI2181317.1 helix-turn-helix domain-containing protein [Bifidobacterium psychraerophilum]
MFTRNSQLATAESRKHIELVLKVARMYYMQNLTQAQIASAVGYSRPTVSRLLQESRDEGIVHIDIGHVLERVMSLEDRLVQRFGLKFARVAPTSPTLAPAETVPEYAASLFSEQAREDSLITVSNGRAVAATVRQIPSRNWPKANVAQMVGALSPSNSMTDSPDICRMLANRLNCTFSPLHAPMIMSSAPIAEAMRKEPQIATSLALGGGADVAIEGVGAVVNDRLSPVFDNYVDAHMVRRMRDLGAVGTVCGHFIDASGTHVHTELCVRTISIDIERLKHIPLVIGVAWGREKIEAIRACLSGGYLSALVTDQHTAESLLAKKP